MSIRIVSRSKQALMLMPTMSGIGFLLKYTHVMLARALIINCHLVDCEQFLFCSHIICCCFLEQKSLKKSQLSLNVTEAFLGDTLA